MPGRQIAHYESNESINADGSSAKPAVTEDDHSYTQHLSKELSSFRLCSATLALFVLLMGLTLYDLFHRSSVVIYIGGSVRVVAWVFLAFCTLNRFLAYDKRMIAAEKEYVLIFNCVIFGMLGSCISFIGRVALMTCEHDIEFYADKPAIDRYAMLSCNPLKGTGLLPSYFYILVVGINIAQLMLNFQDTIGLCIVWTQVAVTLVWIQSANGFYLMVVDDVIVICFILCSFIAAMKNKESFYRIRDKRRADAAALRAQADMIIMEHRMHDMRDLLGNVSHDLKTPVHAFSMELNNLKERVDRVCRISSGSVDESCKQSILTLKDTCAFMLMTINRSLDYTQATAGIPLVPHLNTVCIPEVLTWVLACISRSVDESAIPVTLVVLPNDICTHVITDEQWLKENILCLTSNAVKYTTKGSISVRCHLSKDCQQLRFEVEDTGVGVKGDTRDNLFRPFQRPKITGGTGLGLFSLAKRLEALGGDCGIRDRIDGREGSLFWFCIPYQPDEYAASSLPTRSRSTTDPSAYITSESNDTLEQGEEGMIADKKTVLVVDDSIVIQKTTKRMLVKQGYNVEIAANGFLGLNKMLEKRYDLVLMDIQMPVMDGIEAVRRLRVHEMESGVERSNRQLIIGISANGKSEIEADSLAVGMNGFIPKPFTMDAVAKICSDLEMAI